MKIALFFFLIIKEILARYKNKFSDNSKKHKDEDYPQGHRQRGHYWHLEAHLPDRVSVRLHTHTRSYLRIPSQYRHLLSLEEPPYIYSTIWAQLGASPPPPLWLQEGAEGHGKT